MDSPVTLMSSRSTSARNSLDLLAIVTEEEIEAAIAWLFTEEGLVVEGSGAVGVAALLQKKVYKPVGPVVIVLSGANIDPAKHAKVLAAHPASS